MSCDINLIAIHPLILDEVSRDNDDADRNYYAACLISDKDIFTLWDTYNGNAPDSMQKLIDYIRSFDIPPIINRCLMDKIMDIYQFMPLYGYLEKCKGKHLIVEYW